MCQKALFKDAVSDVHSCTGSAAKQQLASDQKAGFNI